MSMQHVYDQKISSNNTPSQKVYAVMTTKYITYSCILDINVHSYNTYVRTIYLIEYCMLVLNDMYVYS